MGDQVITNNGEGDPLPGGIWTIQLDIAGAHLTTAGGYRVEVVGASQDLISEPETLTVGEPTTTTVAATTTVAPTTTASPAATRAIAASPAFTG